MVCDKTLLCTSYLTVLADMAGHIAHLEGIFTEQHPEKGISSAECGKIHTYLRTSARPTLDRGRKLVPALLRHIEAATSSLPQEATRKLDELPTKVLMRIVSHLVHSGQALLKTNHRFYFLGVHRRFSSTTVSRATLLPLLPYCKVLTGATAKPLLTTMTAHAGVAAQLTRIAFAENGIMGWVGNACSQLTNIESLELLPNRDYMEASYEVFFHLDALPKLQHLSIAPVGLSEVQDRDDACTSLSGCSRLRSLTLELDWEPDNLSAMRLLMQALPCLGLTNLELRRMRAFEGRRLIEDSDQGHSLRFKRCMLEADFSLSQPFVAALAAHTSLLSVWVVGLSPNMLLGDVLAGLAPLTAMRSLRLRDACPFDRAEADEACHWPPSAPSSLNNRSRQALATLVFPMQQLTELQVGSECFGVPSAWTLFDDAELR